MRFAAYIRYSHQDQSENYSKDAQIRIIENYVKSVSGTIVEYYVDRGETATTTANRNEFLRMRRDAQNRSFDALVVAKFDRLNRNRMDAIAIKTLLRRNLGIKVLSATEPSEHDGADGLLIEGILECLAEWYSLNLSQEFKKGKHERAMQGLHNNQAPFGYDKDENKILVKNEKECEGLRLAFNMYATGKNSLTTIANELNRLGYRNKKGGIMSSEMVRDMLHNKTYLGYVKYQPYKKHRDGRRSKAEAIEWHKGQHEAIISTALFQRCEEMIQKRKIEHEYTPPHRDYLLRDKVYCGVCGGKMRSQTQNDKYSYYRCRAKEFALSCSQNGIRSDFIEPQVIAVLESLELPEDWQKAIMSSIGEAIGNQHLELRITEIKAMMMQMDFKWDNGFITDREQYLKQRQQLQKEVETLVPIPSDELMKAAEILSGEWTVEKIRMVLNRVYVKGNSVVALELRPNYHIDIR